MGQKGALRSKGVWGAIIALLPAIDVALVALGLIPAPILTLPSAGMVSGFGALLAGHGRVRAKTRIKGIF